MESKFMPEFHVRVAGDDLAFSAGHFITLEDGSCERLHGHTYRVAVEVFGPLDASECVVDFVAVHQATKSIVGELDHRMLLPTKHPVIRVESRSGEVEARFGERRWLFPAGDCLLLPMANTTTERLAEYIGRRLLDALHPQVIDRLRVEVSEGAAYSAVCTLHSPLSTNHERP